MTAATPRSSSHCASAAVVAELITGKPAALSRPSSGSADRPKWKLTTSGVVSSTTSHIAASNAVRLLDGMGAAGSTASSR
jgi:hypothetical protein